MEGLDCMSAIRCESGEERMLMGIRLLESGKNVVSPPPTIILT